MNYVVGFYGNDWEKDIYELDLKNEEDRLREFCKLFLQNGLNSEYAYLFGLKNA